MQLRVLTFNVFFEPVGLAPRMRAIGKMMERMRPAVVGFQEVTRESLALLKAQAWAKYYDCSADVARPFSEAYFVVLFSALPVRGLETLPFANTGMGRELVLMQVEPAPGQSLFVGTAHLESLPQFASVRVAQLRECLTVLRDRVNNTDGEEESGRKCATECLGAVFMGDTNLMRSDMALLDSRLASIADLEVEPARTGRSKCRECVENIQQGATRVGKMSKECLPSGKTREIRHWYHEACFVDKASEVEKQFVRERSSEASEETAGSQPSIGLATAGLPGGWTDLWLSVKGNTEENGFTYDGKTNGLIKNRSFQSRLDRMYFYPGTTSLREKFSSDSSSVLETIQIVGKHKISDGLWPSDHYGLLSVFNFDDVDDSQTPGSKRAAPSEGDDGKRKSGTRAAPIAIE